jgi:hypothetical protein
MKTLNALILILVVSVILSGCAPAIHDAAKQGNIRTITELLNAGADVNSRDALNFNDTPLTFAALYGKTDVAKLLIERGANIEARNRFGTPLYHAAGRCHTKTIELLIEKGADINSINWRGASPLSAAARYCSTETAKLLIEKGADVDYAMATLQGDSDYPDIARKGIIMLKKLKPKEEITSQPQTYQSITKEDLKTIVQAAMEGAKTQKEEKTATIKTDVDRPSFSPSQIIMGENDLAVIIGIEGYQGLPKSDYSYDDAKLVGDYVKALGFKPRNIELLLDERATKSAIEKTIKTWLLNKAKPDSRVFIYYSGHGAPEPKTGDAYLVPYDGDPNYLTDTGYPLKSLYDNLGKLRVKEAIVVLDACFSGAGGRSVLAKGARPLVMTTTALSVPFNMAVLTATQGTQISTSSPEKGHGVFTYYFLKALKDGKKDIAEIYSYIKPLVEDDAKVLNVQQSPSLNPAPEKITGRFNLIR